MKEGKLDKHGKPNDSTPSDYLNTMGIDKTGAAVPMQTSGAASESPAKKEKKEKKEKKVRQK